MRQAFATGSAPDLLGTLFPPLRTYCPILPTVSAPQALWLLLDCTEALYGGAVGGGKTGALLMAALQYVDVPGYAALIMRRTFPELEQPDGPIPQSLRWFATVPDQIRPVYNKTDHEWVFPSGAVLRFGHLDHPNAMIRYQGGGYHFFGFDELTHFDEQAYEFIGFSRTRRPPVGPLAQVPMRVRGSANPGGPGHGWVKRRFISAPKPDAAFIPAKLADNPGIDQADYISRLEKLSPALRQQLLDGDWGAFEGAAFQIDDDHLIGPLELPGPFDRFESMDYGLNNPTCWLAWAVDYDGNLICFDEFYEPGLPSETAPAILARRHAWRSSDCVGDPNSLAMRTGSTRKWGQPATIRTEFADNGVWIRPGNDNPRAGYTRLRELLKPDPERRFPDWHPRRGQPDSPRLFIVEQACPHLVEQLQTAPLQPVEKRFAGEMVDPDWEGRHGHAVAAARYGVLSRPAPSVEPKPHLSVAVLMPPTPPDELRAELLRQVDEQRNKPVRIRYRHV